MLNKDLEKLIAETKQICNRLRLHENRLNNVKGYIGSVDNDVVHGEPSDDVWALEHGPLGYKRNRWLYDGNRNVVVWTDSVDNNTKQLLEIWLSERGIQPRKHYDSIRQYYDAHPELFSETQTKC